MAYTTKAVSASTQKNNGGTVFGGGAYTNSNVATAVVNHTQTVTEYVPGKVNIPVSPASSGNFGSVRALSAGDFGKTHSGAYVGMILGSSIANVAKTVLTSPGNADQPRKEIAYTQGDRRLNITSWNYSTGVATTGGDAGALMSWGTDEAAHPDYVSPGAIAYQYGGAVAATGRYPTRYAP